MKKTIILAIFPFTIGFVGFQIFFRYVLKPTTNQSSETIVVSKTDSLKNVINELQIELESKSKQWDYDEKQYQMTIFEYELGVDALKYSHPNAFKEFHRIIAYKENYSRVDEEDNNTRLKKYKKNN